jgi:hypothetical protein
MGIQLNPHPAFCRIWIQEHGTITAVLFIAKNTLQGLSMFEELHFGHFIFYVPFMTGEGGTL